MKKAYINRRLFKQTRFDSGSLTSLASVFATLPGAGEYQGTVYRADEPVGTFLLKADEKELARQLDLDFAASWYQAITHADGAKPLTIHPAGRIALFVSEGAGGYALTLSSLSSKKADIVFDSRRLDNGSVFLLSLLRPGLYDVTNQEAGTKARINVLYPRDTSKRQQSMTIKEITVGAKGFTPPKVEMFAAGGVGFQLNAPSRLVVELVKAYAVDDAKYGVMPERREKIQDKSARWRKAKVKVSRKS